MMNVVVYSTENCPWCAKIKEFLNAKEIKFTNKDVGKNRKAAEEMIKLSGQQGFPVTVIGKEVIVGFDEAKLKKALKVK